MTERATAIVDYGAVERNCRLLGSQLGDSTRLCAVVKADGYGHGMQASARAALDGGATMLAVATAREAADLRAAFAEAPILVMGALSEAEVDPVLDAGAEAAAWRPGFVRLLAERAAQRGVTARVHVKHDSGMGRLGEPDPDAVLALVAQVDAAEALQLTGFWTHFATADEPESDFLAEQLGRFTPLAESVRAAHPGCVIHAANSAATLSEPGAHFDMARCGIAIYGLDPFNRDPAAHGLEPALELRSYLADVKPFAAGDSAGYGRTWRAKGDTWVGVLPIGYGDGIRRGLSNNAEVLIGGSRYPLVGTVSMDNITVDLGPEPTVTQGAEAVLIGSQGSEAIRAEDLAARLGTINYEVTCGLSARVPRVPR